MLDVRPYRLGLLPILAALVVVAFSLEGVPDPLEPAAGTIEFDASRTLALTRGVVRVGPTRAPGSEGAAAAADYVKARFDEIASGEVAEQRFEASVDGEDVELRNVLLTLPGTTNQAIVVLAERDSRAGSGAASSAAATGVLLELAAELGLSGRNHTLIFGSIDGAAAEAEGTRELLDALPDHTAVDVALVISQPGTSELSKPHLVISSTDDRRPSMELIRTAEETLSSRAELGAGLDGALGQIARFALPAAAGAQAVLLADGKDSLAVSGAGEVPLPPEQAGDEALDSDSLERLGAAALTLVGAIDTAGAGVADEPGTYVSLGDNVVPGWAISVLALALLIPPAMVVAAALARARRDRGAGIALAWAGEWALAALAALLVLYGLALGGLIPRPEMPYDPGQFEIGALEVLAMAVLAGAGVVAWWALGVRRAPARPERAVLGAGAGAVIAAAGALAWLANPFLALVLAPLAHVVLVHGAPPRRRAALVVPVAALAALPLVACVLHVAGALDWSGSTPWQLVVLVAGGGLGLIPAAAILVALAGVAAVIRSCFGGGSSEPA